MRFLKVLLFLVLALALAWFAALNWVPVTVRLWAPYELVIRLPVLIVAAVLLGWLPAAIVHSLNRWRWHRRLARTEQALEARRVAEPPAATATAATTPSISPAAPTATPEPLPSVPPIVPSAGA